MLMFFRKKYYFLLIVYLSCKSIKRLNIGDKVLYKGKHYVLTQGVSNPKWNMSGHGEYHENVHLQNFTKVHTPATWTKSFKRTYNFYMSYWYGIWCRNGIEDWMKH